MDTSLNTPVGRNLSKCHSDVKINAYFTIVRPILEYTQPVSGIHIMNIQ